MAWRSGSEWDPDVEGLTTAVGRQLARAREPDGRYGRLLAGHFAQGMVLTGREGVDAIGSLLAEVEDFLTAHLSRCDGLFMLQGLRRLSRRLWISNHYDPGTYPTRRLAELAVHRWARWRRVQTNPDALAFRWTAGDARDIAHVLSLAEAYEAGAAIRRRLAKGQALEITDAYVPHVVPEGEKGERLDRLIAVLDRRRMNFEDPLAFLGQLTTGTDDVESPLVLAAVWRPVTDLVQDMDTLVDPDPEGDPWPLLPAHDLQCFWGPAAGTDELLEATEYLTGWMRDRHGCSPTDVLLVLQLLSAKVMEQVNSDPFGPERLWRYGFACARWPSNDEFAQLLGAAAEMDVPGVTEVTKDTVAAAAVLVQTDPAALSLDQPIATRPVVRLGDWYAYDALSYSGLFQGLVADARADPATEGKARRRLEQQAHARLGTLGQQPWPQGKQIRHAGADLTDLDASVVIGDLLVAADCYSSNWTGALDRGDHSATRNRVQHLRDKLAGWDSTWRRIAKGEGRDSLLPAIQPIRRVLPVVVTAGPEWIDQDASENPALWFDDPIPRVLTIEELIELLSDSDTRPLPHTIVFA